MLAPLASAETASLELRRYSSCACAVVFAPAGVSDASSAFFCCLSCSAFLFCADGYWARVELERLLRSRQVVLAAQAE
jgi:hypothetical protein